MSKNIPLLILSGVDLSGKSFISKKLLENFPNVFYIAKKFTTIKSLVENDDQMYFYIDKNLFKEKTLDNEILSLRKVTNNKYISNEKLHFEENKFNLKDDHNDIDYICYMKDPIRTVSYSNKICILNYNYSELLKFLKINFLKSYSINVVPENPELLADKIFNHKYSYLINNTNEDMIYDELIKEVEYNRNMITYFYKSKLFEDEIVNNYSNIFDFNLKVERIKSLYPQLITEFMNNKNANKEKSDLRKTLNKDIDILKKFKI